MVEVIHYAGDANLATGTPVRVIAYFSSGVRGTTVEGTVVHISWVLSIAISVPVLPTSFAYPARNRLANHKPASPRKFLHQWLVWVANNYRAITDAQST